MYFQDRFQKPTPFSPDVAVAIDDVIDKKVSLFDAHASQFYEWMPWLDGTLDRVPKDPAGRLQQVIQMEKIISEDLPTIFLYYTPRVVPYVASLKGPIQRLVPEAGPGVRNIYDWEWTS